MSRRGVFRSIDDVLNSSIAARGSSSSITGIDRVFKSTRLEDMIYTDLRMDDGNMDAISDKGTTQLPSFNALSRDIFQSFYSLGLRRHDEDALSDAAKHFHTPILDDMMVGEQYPTIKAVCEGRLLPAYEAATEFTESITNNLSALMKAASGQKGSLNTLEKAHQHEKKLQQELASLLEKREQQGGDPDLDRSIVDKANQTHSKARQIEAITGQIQDNLLKNREDISSVLSVAMECAKDKAEEAALTMATWGQDDSDTSPQQLKENRALFEKVRNSETLNAVTRFLGRFKEMAAKARKNSYAYGRGEKYTLELGNSLGRVITSEFAALAVPSAIPLFLRKYNSRGLQQYKRRESIFKGSGDIIMCLDESASTREEAPWGKAVAFALLDAAMIGNRKFALIHFSGSGNFKTDVFLPGQYSTADVFAAAETFLNGGTDFDTPLKEALRLMENEGFTNADIVFVTDGVCALSSASQAMIKAKQSALNFKITGVLLDMESPGMDFSLKAFCQEILRTSELSQNSIVETLIQARV